MSSVIHSHCCQVSITGEPWAINHVKSNLRRILHDKFGKGDCSIISYDDGEICFYFDLKLELPDLELPEDSLRGIYEMPGVHQLFLIVNTWSGVSIWSDGKRTDFDHPGYVRIGDVSNLLD